MKERLIDAAIVVITIPLVALFWYYALRAAMGAR